MKRGYKLFTRDNEFNSLWYRLYGCYEKQSVTRLAKELRSGGTFLDLGANLGLFSIDLATNSKVSVIAFEPNQVTATLLRKSVTLNNLENSIHIKEVAVADQNGRLEFKDNSENAGDSALLQEGNKKKAGSIYTVDVIALDDDVEIQSKLAKMPPIKAIKIDIQGAEVKALKGMQNTIKTNRPALLIEVSEGSLHEFSTTKQELLSLLDDYGYFVAERMDGNILVLPISNKNA